MVDMEGRDLEDERAQYLMYCKITTEENVKNKEGRSCSNCICGRNLLQAETPVHLFCSWNQCRAEEYPAVYPTDYCEFHMLKHN